MKRRFVVDKDKVRYKTITKFNKRRLNLKVDGVSITVVPIENTMLGKGGCIEFVDNQGNIYKCNINHIFDRGLSTAHSYYFDEVLGRYGYTKKEEKFSLKSYLKNLIKR